MASNTPFEATLFTCVAHPPHGSLRCAAAGCGCAGQRRDGQTGIRLADPMTTHPLPPLPVCSSRP
eukprot:3242273-Alexandrium_andersonii.AAC.2